MSKLRLLALMVATLAVTATTVVPAAAAPPPGSSTAWFDGRIIDLKQGWGDAKACVIWNSAGIRQCFRTESAMKLWLSTQKATSSTQGINVTCSTALKLYDGLNYTSSTIWFYDRAQWHNLATFGWSNRPSSFKIGACDSILADGSSGGGDWYPLYNTEAWDVAGTMMAGWNNRVSSLYIY